jgi:multiple sugar transport system substrate-binding protein
MKPSMSRPAAAAALAGLLALTACGSDSGGDPDSPVSLRVAVWTANDTHLALFDEIADAYMAENPRVEKITFDPLPFDGYTTALTTQIAGGNAPDLAWIFESSAPDFVSSGALVPLDKVLQETEGYEYDDLVPATTELWREGDQLFAYPFSTSPFAVFANLDLLAEAGLPAPAEMAASGDWNWEEAITASATVAAETDASGMVIRDFDYTGWDNLATLWTGWDAEAWDGDSRCGFDRPEMVEAMSFLHEAVFERGALPGPGTSADFFAGEAAYTVTQISRAALLEEAGFAWDMVPLPAGPVGEYSVIGQAGLGVLRLSDNPEAASDFLAYFTGPENSAKLAQFFPPPRESQLTAETLAQTNPLLTAGQLQDTVVAGIANGVVKPSHMGQEQISGTVRAELDALWLPGADVPAVLGDVCEAVQPLLDR